MKVSPVANGLRKRFPEARPFYASQTLLQSPCAFCSNPARARPLAPRPAECAYRSVRALRAPPRPLHHRRPPQAPRVSRVGILGASRSILWRPECARALRRPRTRRSRIQPDRPPVHRRWLRRFPLPAPPSRRIRLTARIHPSRRWNATPRCMDHLRRPLRAPRQQTAARGNRAVRTLSRRRDRRAAAGARHRLSGQGRL